MSFTQFDFLIFMVVFLPLYFSFSRRLQCQNILVFLASVVFYAWWSKAMLLLILAVSLVGYFGAIGVERWPARKKILLILVIVTLLTILAYFKYANFFIEGFVRVLNFFGVGNELFVLNIILPIGISFHTFQTMAYVIDVYRGDFSAEKNFLKFNAFALFFPQLVAGPIERAHELLPQFSLPRHFSIKTLSHSFHLIVLGYFFKVFIADSAAEIVNVAFRPDQTSGWWTILGTMAFGLQIYGDFLGYSMIAKGVALLLGFELRWNFIHPYWAKSIKEFWAGWHVTLSRWLRDYLYIPLGGNRGGVMAAPRNTLITMTLGGLWHGANWTFIVWGLFHGIALAIFHIYSRSNFKLPNKYFGWILTMGVVYIGWFFFRAKNWLEIKGMLLALRNMEWYPAHYSVLISIVFLYSIVFFIEYFERTTGDRYAVLRLSPWISSTLYGAALFLVLVYSNRAGSSFIYFQF